jgi:hypothetical protein
MQFRGGDLYFGVVKGAPVEPESGFFTFISILQRVVIIHRENVRIKLKLKGNKTF